MDDPKPLPDQGEKIDASGSQGFVYKPSGPLEQVFGDKVDTGGGAYTVINITTTVVSEAQVKTIEDLPPEPGEPPFQGLKYFDERDAERFFGREQLTARIVARLHRTRFLAIIGASGSGKSSAVRAGVIPALRRGQALAEGVLPPTNSGQWAVRVLTPTAHPLETLAAALLPPSESLAAVAALRDELAAEPQALGLAVRRYLAGQQRDHMLLFVDQFEEIYTLCRRPEEREAFLAGLLEAAAGADEGPLSVLIALRADYYAQVAQNDRLREVVSQYQEFIGAMSREELVRAIDRPLAQGGWQIQQGLIEVILDDIGYEPGALPLLSHALHETWLRRRGRTLTLSGYTEAGGVRGALAKTAESVFFSLPEDQQPVARLIFLRMAEVGQDSQDTRRRATYAELITHASNELVINAVVGVLADARLVITDTLQPGGEKVVQVAHECLIREWPTLRGWLDEDRAGLILQQRLAEDTAEWNRMGRESGGLYRGARLQAAAQYAVGHPEALSLLEQEFLAESQKIAAEEAEQARRLARAARNQRIFLGVTAALMLVIAYLAYTYFIDRPPAVMDGFFNVAIASAAGPATGDEGAAPSFGELLYGSLRTELVNSPNVLVWHDNPELQKRNVLIGPVAGTTLETRAQAAQSLADRLNADMVIYGAEQAGPGGPHYALEFFLRPRQGYDFEDLQGGFDLGCSMPVDSQTNSIAMQTELAPCASALAHLALGLSESQYGHSLDAMEAFQQAARFYPESAIVHFLIGREALFLADRESALDFVDREEFYSRAEEAFQQSARWDPQYARAQIGLGSVYFKRARDILAAAGDEPTPEALAPAQSYIEKAVQHYERAGDLAQNAGNPALNVESVARLGLGNAYNLNGRIFELTDQPVAAAQQFDLAIQTLEPTVAPLEQAGQARYLAQALEYLGTAYQWKGYVAEVALNYQQALAAYQRALEYYDLCLDQAGASQDFILKNDIAGGVCRPGKDFVQQKLTSLGGSQG